MNRTLSLNQKPISGKCVLYVMSRDQRVADNFGLVGAQQTALEHGLPLAVVFCLLPKVGNRAREQYQWMLTGLQQVERDLTRCNIPFMMFVGDPADTLRGALHHLKPAAVFFDFSPLNRPRRLQQEIADVSPSAVFVTDSHNVVPVWQASDKQEFAARTLRPKIHRLLADYLEPPVPLVRHPHRWHGTVRTIHELASLIQESLDKLPSNGQTLAWQSGEAPAHQALETFINRHLAGYDQARNDPTQDSQSGLSPYLHFGQIWSGTVVAEIQQAVAHSSKLKVGADAYIEELVVRKELSDNFCYYNTNYTSLSGAPDWAQKTLQAHAQDAREFIYTKNQLEKAQTHDPAWNAAQNQLVKTGKMHGYMRMYWAKKVLEWTASPQDAQNILIHLNDFYSLDGADPNGYVGILWSIAGLHDRPWFDRPVYGTVRYMNYGGLRRKFDIATYEAHWNGGHNHAVG